MRIQAYAKVNLFLEIQGKRADGYHTLSTLFQTISLADEIKIQPSADLRLSCSEASLPCDERNLAFRAALRLKEALRESRGAHLILVKKIPMGAGLGGGSSDAASVLKGVSAVWKRRLPPAQLRRCAKKLGADVPFFLEGGTCSAGGIGDRLTHLPSLAKTWMVLVYPGFGVSTQDAYGLIKPSSESPQSIRPLRLHLGKPVSQWAPFLFNRFEEFVFKKFPKVQQLKEDLLRAGALNALMSGSGSTVFGVVRSRSEGSALLSKISRTYPQSWLVHTL